MAFNNRSKDCKDYKDIVGDYMKRFSYKAYEQDDDEDTISTDSTAR